MLITFYQIDPSTIEGIVEFVHFQYNLYYYVTSVNLVFVSGQIINNKVLILQ